MNAGELELEPLHREALRAFLVGVATPLGLWVGWQLQDASSPVRVRAAELVESGRGVVERARERWHRRQIDDLIAHVHETPAATPAEPETEAAP